jgi:hypothetical protein
MGTVTQGKQGFSVGWKAAGLALALALGSAATPALADNDRHRGWDRGGGWNGHNGHHRHHVPPGHAKRHHGHGHYGPVYYYAPPPVVYVPRPVYHAPSPGVTIIFPLDFN